MTKVVPSAKLITPNYFEKHASDFQLPMGPTLSQGTLEEIHWVVLIYIPTALILFFCYLGPPSLHRPLCYPLSFDTMPAGLLEPLKDVRNCGPLPFSMAVLIRTSKFSKDIL